MTTNEFLPITNDLESERATAEIDRLMNDAAADNDSTLSELAKAVEAYEAIRYPIAAPSQADMLRYLMQDARGIDSARLAADTGLTDNRIAEVLGGSALTVVEVGTLSSYFHVEPAVFNQD